MSGTQSINAAAVTPGNWISQTINGMQYDVLLPANYDPSIKYPTLLYLHQLDMGNDPSGLQAEVDPWFNTTTFRTDYPSIIVRPLLDQTADPSGQTINWGGISGPDSAGETNALAALKQVMAQYSTDSSRIYVTGNSMGGIGTEDMIIKYNAYTGTEGKIFAAGLSLAGADYAQGYPTPNASVVTGLKNVPFWAIHGGQDTTVPLTWDQNLYAAEQAIGGDMKYTQDNSLGHDVWDTYYPQVGAGSPLGWLFGQSTGGSAIPPPPPPVFTGPVSPDKTAITGTAGTITDVSGNKWTITAAGQVAVNGVADTTTANVIKLAYVSGAIWQENNSNLWWGEAKPNAGWTLGGGTATSPLPPVSPPSANDTVVKAGSTAAIVDASGNTWTITTAGQVAVNGTADTTTANVTELAYVNGAIWQENKSNLWWGETQPNGGWTLGAGTATSPLPVVTTVTPSANNTVVKAGSTTAIVDAGGNTWTITAAGQVAVNGTADTTTAHVAELAYVNKQVWQENSSNLWWGKTSPTDAWSPGAGTATSPLPASSVITLDPTQTSATISLSQISVIATAGNHMVLIQGVQDKINLSGGTNTITEGRNGNMYIMPAAGKGYDIFTNNILTTADKLDLRTALAATNWNGAAAGLASYLSVANTAQGAVLSVAPTAGASGVAIATIHGATNVTLSSLLPHAIT